MIYLRMMETVECGVRDELRVKDVCDTLCDARIDLEDVTVSVPKEAGVYCVQAMQVVRAISARYPGEQVSLMGTGTTLLTRRRDKRKKGLALRTAAAFLVLLAGSALAIMWFHADVNMFEAQKEMYRAITGGGEPSALLVALPYALGVGLGVAFYYALIGKKTISPLDVKLSEYKMSILKERAAKEEQRGE
ncbi:stage V sporulation protein AA [Beduinella massiliensis]|uniref:stage V sporulation protein AA n=1 Tax=Beduinella massiliensis TaxID=1852363 RepID=UPI000C8641FB